MFRTLLFSLSFLLPLFGMSDGPEATSANLSLISRIEPISQYPTLPTGCEATATVMALCYLGKDVGLAEFADLLPCRPVSEAPDPNEYFVGDPFSDEGSFGCFEQVIIDTVNENYPSLRASKVDGSLDQLCAYIDDGSPVILWVTMEMREPVLTRSWTLPDGTAFTWPGHEHCMLLVGYDEQTYYFNDPREGECVTYEKALSQLRFEEMGSRAVVVER